MGSVSVSWLKVLGFIHVNAAPVSMSIRVCRPLMLPLINMDEVGTCGVSWGVLSCLGARFFIPRRSRVPFLVGVGSFGNFERIYFVAL